MVDGGVVWLVSLFLPLGSSIVDSSRPGRMELAQDSRGLVCNIRAHLVSGALGLGDVSKGSCAALSFPFLSTQGYTLFSWMPNFLPSTQCDPWGECASMSERSQEMQKISRAALPLPLLWKNRQPAP